MKVVLDTNIIYGDFFLRNSKLLSLCDTARKFGMEIYVPEVVVDEIVNQYAEKIEAAKNELKNALRTMKFVSPDKTPANPVTDEVKSELLSKYPGILADRLSELGIKRLPYPKISHIDLVKRDLARRKPFQPSGKGYRDALIWESVLNLITPPDKDLKVFLLNKNLNDFSEKGKLHQDLVADLTSRDIEPEAVGFFANLSDFDKEYITPLQEKLTKLESDYLNKSVIGSIKLNDYIESHLSDAISDLFDDETFLYRQGVEAPIENATFNGMDNIESRITSIRYLSENRVIVDVEATVDVYYEGFLYKADYWLISDDEQPAIVNEDWNKHYMLVSDMMNVMLDISLVIDKDLKEVVSHNVDFHSYS